MLLKTLRWNWFLTGPLDILINLVKESKVSIVSVTAFIAHFVPDEAAAMLASSILCGGLYEFDSLVSVRAAELYEDLKQERMPQLGGNMCKYAQEAKPILSAAHHG